LPCDNPRRVASGSGERRLWPSAQRVGGAFGRYLPPQPSQCAKSAGSVAWRSAQHWTPLLHLLPLSESLASLEEEEEKAEEAIRKDPAHMDETGGPIGNADGNNPERKRGWLGVLVTPCACGVSFGPEPLSRGGQRLFGVRLSRGSRSGIAMGTTASTPCTAARFAGPTSSVISPPSRNAPASAKRWADGC
jgi:hypothetical protein